MLKKLLVGLCLLATFGCKGELSSEVGTPPNGPLPNNDVVVNPDVSGAGATVIRRLSREELDQTLEDLLGDTAGLGTLYLPEDTVDPFDNDGTTQRVSQTLIEALERIATDAASRAVEPDRRDSLLNCTPSGPGDEACFKQFVSEFGLRALRRPVSEEDVERYMPLLAFGLEDNNFYTAIELVIQAMLQEPGFVYHVEQGIPVYGRPNLYRLTSFEVAERLSFFLWGTTPDDELLDAAQNGRLRTSEDLRAQAERLLAHPKAQARLIRFHAMWMGWHRLGTGTPLGAAMKAETDALIRKIVFEEKANYLTLFTHDETFINPLLADHYGLPSPQNSEGAWVSYGTSGRGGILSHGSFLQVASRFGDTSPTQRGIVIRERLMCTEIQPPPPTVNIDEPPTADSPCKKDRYATILAQASCVGCHNQMDPIGFGLENYDQFGRFRTHDDGLEECEIDGQGNLVGVGTFAGPKELGEVLVESGALADCTVTQLFRFALAHRETSEDEVTLNNLKARFGESGYRFDTLVLDLVSEESFVYRSVKEAP